MCLTISLAKQVFAFQITLKQGLTCWERLKNKWSLFDTQPCEIKNLSLKLIKSLEKFDEKFEGLIIGWLECIVYACMIWAKYNVTKHNNSYIHKNTHINNQLDN